MSDRQPQLLIREGFVTDPAALFSLLDRDAAWEHRIKKRPTASYGVPYNYSGLSYEPTPMHPALVPLCDALEAAVGFRPNNCLLNYYASGSAAMGFHVDATDNLVPRSGVAIVSLGASRSLTFRSCMHEGVECAYRLVSGSLLYMPNEVQDEWLHAVRKEPGAGPRMSLTFRLVRE